MRLPAWLRRLFQPVRCVNCGRRIRPVLPSARFETGDTWEHSNGYVYCGDHEKKAVPPLFSINIKMTGGRG